MSSEDQKHVADPGLSPTTLSPEDLEAALSYVDGELDEQAKVEFEARLKKSPELQVQVEEFQVVGSFVSSHLEAESQRVPEARFEQIWDRFDQAVDREERLQQSAREQEARGPLAHLWHRFWGPKPMMVTMAGMVAATAFWIISKPDSPNQEAGIAAKVSAPEAKQAPPSGDESNESDKGESAPKLAQGSVVEDELLDPVSNEASIQHIEFGGRSGSIAQIEGRHGTTTVIWVNDDEDTAQVEKERSL